MLTCAAFARLVGVTPETIRRWVREEKLRPAGRTPGGQLRFTEDQVDTLLSGERPTGLASALEAHVLAARAKLRARRGA